MNFLFPYMARWKAINWTRYQRILSAIAEDGHTVHVLQPPSTKSMETNFQEIKVNLSENLYLHEIELGAFFWNHEFPLHKIAKKGYYSLACIPAVQKFIKKYDIDVLMVYNLSQFPLIQSASCFTVFDFADDYIDMLKYELGRFNNKAILNLGQTILHKMVKKADLTTAVSQVLANKVSDIGFVKVIANGVDLNSFTIHQKSEMRDQLPKPIIGFIGSFEYFIDFDIILQAAKKLKEYTFLMVGSGRRFEYVQQKKQQLELENVVLTGGVPFLEIPKYINTMDICLNIFKDMPVSHGASPIKLFEYLAMQKPVISTRLDEVENINHDFLFFANTEKELVNSIQNILAHQGQTKKMVNRAYDYVKKNYTWDFLVKDFLQTIKEKMAA